MFFFLKRSSIGFLYLWLNFTIQYNISIYNLILTDQNMLTWCSIKVSVVQNSNTVLKLAISLF